MDTSNKSHVKETSSELFHEGKKMANELYEDSLNQVGKAQENVKEYSEELLTKVKENPLASILIAGGIGFILSSLLKK